MSRLVSVTANTDAYMEDGERFCTKNKKYRVEHWSKEMFCIIDDNEQPHWFEYNDCPYLDLIYVD